MLVGQLFSAVALFRADEIDAAELRGIARSTVAAYKKNYCSIHHQELKHKLASIAQPVLDDPNKVSTKDLSFLQLHDQFIQSKLNQPNPLSEKMQKEYKGFRDYVVHVRPDFAEMPVVSITRRLVKSVIMDYLILPRRNKKPYSKQSWPELVVYMEHNEIPPEDRQAPKTADNVRKWLQGVFAYAVEEELLISTPASKLNLNLDLESTRGCYTSAEAAKLDNGFLSWPKVQQKWVGLLALYHGCRAGEATQLRKQDIKWDQVSGRWYMVITEEAGSTKTKSSNRLVPLHNRLIDTGFLEYLSTCKDDLFFPECSGQKMTAWLYKFQQTVGVEKYDDLGMKRDFHSFRHTVVTALRRRGNLNESAIQSIVGHKRTNMGITDVYSHGFQVSDLVKVIDQLSYVSESCEKLPTSCV